MPDKTLRLLRNFRLPGGVGRTKRGRHETICAPQSARLLLSGRAAMTTFFLICAARHALQDRILLGRMNVALDAKGRADAERLSRFLAGRIKAIAVQSSPRTRALQTAVTIARALHCPV